MPLPKSQTEFDPKTAFDPNRTPFNSPGANYTYWTHPQAGELMINSATKVVTNFPGKLYPQYPLKVPDELMAVDQPNIRTCGTPTAENKGCTAAVGGGCPILRKYGRVGPCNVIIEKHAKVDSVPCFMAYCGITVHGRPTSQVHYVEDGWRVLTDRTNIPQTMLDEGTRRRVVRYAEVQDLAPFYEEAKVGRFAEPPVVPKKRGRPKKEPVVAD
jgi:hypothetical protein